jgi:hypothetical protein
LTIPLQPVRIIGMIKIKKNPNFPQFLEVFNGISLIEEVQGRAKAFRIAKKLAKEQGEKWFMFRDKIVDIDS